MRFAAQWAGYTWEQFAALDGEEQDQIVATFEAAKRIEAVNAYESSKRIRPAKR